MNTSGNDCKVADSIVEFVGHFYKKGDKFDCSDFDVCLWEKPWEDIVDNVEVENDCLGQIIEDKKNLVLFKEDCFSMEIGSIISLSPYSYDSGIQWMVSEVGFNEVFNEFNDDVIKLGLFQFYRKCSPASKQVQVDTLDRLLLDLKLEVINEEPKIIRVLTVWSFTSFGSGEDTDYEWDLIGTIDITKITSILESR